MKIKTKFWLLVFLLGGIVILPDKLVFAQAEPRGFSLNPYYQEINIRKDQSSAPFSIEVKNTTEAPAVFRVSVLDFGTLNETGGVAFLGAADNLKYSLASWIDLQNDTLVIKPSETQVIKGTVQNRESLSPGGHYGAVYLKLEDGDSNSDSKNVAFNASFASLMFVRKIGGEIYGLDLKSADLPKNIFKLPASATLRFQNSGNVHVTPRGTVKITDPLGRTVNKGIINEQSAIVLPESFRVLSTKLKDMAMAFIPGRYKYAIAYRYDGKDDFAIQSGSFWFVPPIFIAVLLGLVLATFIFIRLRLKNKKQASTNEILEK